MIHEGIYYEIHGEGAPLLLTFPVMASPWPGDPELNILKGYLDRLTDRYKVLVLDYPNLDPAIGKTTPMPPEEFTADRACSDLLAVASAAGFDRFGFWGFSFGGVMGLQLASRTDRLTALVCGGWPPLGAPYVDMLTITRMMAADPEMPMKIDQFVTYYESIQGWPEAEAVKNLSCPRMTFTGANDEMPYPEGITLRLAPTIREHRTELERQGWYVTEIPDKDHGVFTDPETMVPVVRQFLDNAI